MLIKTLITQYILFWFVLSGFAYANQTDSSIPYHVEIQGIKDEALVEKLLEYSTAHQQEESLPKSLFALEYRAKKDLPIFLKFLRSKAYFNSKIVVESEKQADDTALIFRFNLGKQYLLEKVTIEIDNPDLDKPSIEDLKLTLKQPALTSEILNAEELLLTFIKNQAHPFAKLCPRKVIVNHDTQSVAVNFCVESKQKVFIGEVSFTGNDNVEADFLRDLIQWESGIPYNQEQLDEKRLKLIDSRLFTTAHLKLATQADEKGHYPVSFELTERLPRTVSAGLRLTTDEELFLLRLAWEHRNLWQRGEALETELNISLVKSSLEASFRKPAFYLPENTLIIDSIITKEDTDAYESLRAEFIGAIEYQFNKKQRINAGIAYRFSRVTEEGEDTENFNLISLPARFSWDFSDNFLEPTSGGRFWLDTQPFLDVDSGATFFKQKIRFNYYLSLLDSDDLIWANRVIMGNMWGANIEAIPADLRFFAGGGDTIRGYSFQSVSPKDIHGDLQGGRSLIALSSELRGWITENIGLVAFIDAGRAYENEYQDFNEPLQIGAGLGLRYKTPIGALRADIARPINKREEDDEFQFYISIGHTF